MDYLAPWPTVIGLTNIAGKIDLDCLSDEIFNLNLLTKGEDASQQWATHEAVPLIMSLRDDIINPLVEQYSLEQWEYPLTDYRVETNAKWIPQGEGLYPHLHPGSNLSAIIYPKDSPSGITLFDPRMNASRGYPKPIRRGYMKPVTISPKAGDVLIIPSYIQHSVSYVKEEVRLSLLFEYYFGGEV